MQTLFTVEDIVEMKIEQAKVLLHEIDIATAHGYTHHLNACKSELELVKYQITHPECLLEV